MIHESTLPFQFDIGLYIGVGFDVFVGLLLFCLSFYNGYIHNKYDLGLLSHGQVAISGIVGTVVVFGSPARVTPTFFNVFRGWQLYSHCFVSLHFLFGAFVEEGKLIDRKRDESYNLQRQYGELIWIPVHEAPRSCLSEEQVKDLEMQLQDIERESNERIRMWRIYCSSMSTLFLGSGVYFFVAAGLNRLDEEKWFEAG